MYVCAASPKHHTHAPGYALDGAAADTKGYNYKSSPEDSAKKKTTTNHVIKLGTQNTWVGQERVGAVGQKSTSAVSRMGFMCWR